MGLSRRRQQGITLIEVLIAVVIALGLIAVAADWMNREARRSRNQNAAEWLRIAASGAKAYRNANKAALLASAGPATPHTISSGAIAPYLPAGFNQVNAYGQSFQVRFIEPTPGQLDGLLLTFNGDTLDGLDLLHVAGAARGGAGYIDPSNSAQARGPNGNWTVSLAPYGGTVGAGKLAYALFYDEVTSLGGGPGGNFLSRDAVAGQPELNRMNTAIDMANNDLNSAGWVRGREGMFGAISIGSNTYGAPYAYETFGLPAGNNFRFNIAGQEQASIMGDGTLNARHALAAPNVNATYVNAWDLRAGGGVYAGVTVDSPLFRGTEYYADGWFRSNGDTGWYNQRWGGGFHMSDATWIRAYGGKNIYSSGEIRGGYLSAENNINANGTIQAGWDVNAGNAVNTNNINANNATVHGTINTNTVNANGNVGVAGRVTANDLALNSVVSPGWGCSPNGLLARTPAGEVLSCVNGVFAKPAGVSETIAVGSTTTSQGNYWVYAYCPAGYRVVGGGYEVSYMQKASSPEGPQASRAIPELNAWGVRSGGGANSETAVYAYALCGR